MPLSSLVEFGTIFASARTRLPRVQAKWLKWGGLTLALLTTSLVYAPSASSQVISQETEMSNSHYTLTSSVGATQSTNSANSVYQIESVVGLADPATRRFLPGDLDGDGVVEVSDVIIVLRGSLGESLTLAQIADGDVIPLNPDGTRGDGRITIADVTFLLRLSLGLETL